MKKKMLASAIGAFIGSMTLGAALMLAPNNASAANDQTIFSDSFTNSTLEGSAWTKEGDVSLATTMGTSTDPITEDFSDATLNGWQTSGGVSVSGGKGIFDASADGFFSTTAKYTNFKLQFTVTERTSAFQLMVGQSSQTATPGSNKYIQFNQDRAVCCETSGAGSSNAGVLSAWVNGTTWTLTVDNGKVSLSSESGKTCENWDIGAGEGYVVFLSKAGSSMQLDDVSIKDNTLSVDGYRAAIGTEGGSLISNAVVPGLDTRLGFEGATEFIFLPDLSGLGDATFTASLGDVSVQVVPDGGRYMMKFFDGDKEMAVSGNASVLLSHEHYFYVTLRQNGSLSASYKGIGYVTDEVVTSSPYGSIKFTVTEGADSTVYIDNVSLKTDEYEKASKVLQGEVTQDFESAGKATWSADGIVSTLSTEHVTEGTYSNAFTIPATRRWFECHIAVGDIVASEYEKFTFDYYIAGGMAISSPGLGGVGESGTIELPASSVGISGGVMVLVFDQYEYAEKVLYLDNFKAYKYVDAVDEKVSHIFKDESGKLYYAKGVNSENESVALSTVAPATAPKKDGYTFAGWAKDGKVVDNLVDNTADAIYTPTYAYGEVKYVSATLEGDIGLNFYLNLPAAVMADANATVTLQLGDKSQTLKVADAITTDLGKKFTARVAAQDYDKVVTMSLNTTAGNGVTYTYSVKDYADAIILADGDAYKAFKPVAETLKNYGAAAQDYFSKKTDLTATNTDVTVDVLEEYAPVIVEDKAMDGVQILGMTLLMESKTTLRFYFATSEEIAATLVCKVDGTVVTPKSKSSATTNYYYIEVTDIAAQDLDKTHTFTVGTHTQQVSAFSYAYLAATSASTDIALNNAVRAMYLYSKAAEEYFNPTTIEPVATAASYWDDNSEWKDTFNFVLNVEEGRDVRVLQLTDLQIIDAAQQRTAGRLPDGHIGNTSWVAEKMYDNAFKYMREAVEKAQPDLIVLSGDNTYGEFDDNGTSLKALVKEIDSYQIPWTLTWGNHDNETYKGTVWMQSQYASSEYCRFTIEDGGITGSGNFTVGVVQGGQLTTAIFCVDSNGHSGISASHPSGESSYISDKTVGVQQDQINWIQSKLTAIKNANGGVAVQSMGFLHHSLYGLRKGLETKYGYTGTAPFVLDSKNQATTAGITVKDGDYGALNYEPSWTDVVGKGGSTELALHNVSKAGNIVGWFMGHEHVNSASVLYDGVRYTYGLKASLYDSYQSGDIGGTLITVGQNSSMKSCHLYTDFGTTRP